MNEQMNKDFNTASTGDYTQERVSPANLGLSENVGREGISSENLGHWETVDQSDRRGNRATGQNSPVYTESTGGNKIREINIREVNRGFIVTAGCHTFAISTTSELIKLLTVYIDNPDETERLWFSGKLVQR